MSAHTPGPWETRSALGDLGTKRVYSTGKGSLLICTPGFLRDAATADANANLIAAAPDLLQACKWALTALKGREHDQFLRDSIAKATGEAA